SAGALAILAVPDWIHPDVWSHAHSRHSGDAAPDFHVSDRSPLGTVEPVVQSRRLDSGAQLPDLRVEPALFRETRRCRRGRPLGRLDIGMVHDVASAGVQLRVDPYGPQSQASVG